MKHQHSATLLLSSCLLSLLLDPSEAASQSESSQGIIEEVVVTAQKREENLQQVPIAISTFDAQTLADRQMEDITDLAMSVPNMTMTTTTADNLQYVVTLRGLFQSDGVLTGDSPVALYVDGVVLPKMAGAVFDFVDLERVEVLRGPQGTLYGRNTPAGAINLITRKPSAEPQLEALVGFGNYDRQEYRLGVDSGAYELGELGALSARLSGRFMQRDGWVEDAVTGDDLDSRDRFGGRLALRWDSGDRLTVDYSYDHVDIKELPPAIQLTEDRTGFLGDYVTDFDDRRDDTALSYSLSASEPGTFAIGRKYTRLDIDAHALTVNYALSDSQSLRSITSYREMQNEAPTDNDGAPVAWADFNTYNDLESTSQEFQLTGETDSGNLSYVAGAFFYREEGDARAPGVFGFGTVKQEPRFSIDNDSWAVYSQVDWRPDVLEQRLTVTGGLRYTDETRKLHDAVVLYNDEVELARVDEESQGYSKVTPSATLRWDFTDDMNAYLRYAEGYRSGGFNGRATTTEQLQEPFEEENLTSYELGFKANLLNDRLRLNAAAFYNDFENLQTVLTEPASTGEGFQTRNSNIGKISIRGVELEAALAITSRITLYSTYAYLDTDVEDYQYCLPQSDGSCEVENIGNRRRMAMTPENTFSLAADVDILEGAYGDLSLHADMNWQDDMFGAGQVLLYDNKQDDPTLIESYAVVNALLKWEGIPLGGHELEVDVWTKNLLDEDSPLFAVDLTGSLDVIYARYMMPRTYGINVSVKF